MARFSSSTSLSGFLPHWCWLRWCQPLRKHSLASRFQLHKKHQGNVMIILSLLFVLAIANGYEMIWVDVKRNNHCKHDNRNDCHDGDDHDDDHNDRHHAYDYNDDGKTTIIPPKLPVSSSGWRSWPHPWFATSQHSWLHVTSGDLEWPNRMGIHLNHTNTPLVWNIYCIYLKSPYNTTVLYTL